MDNKFLEKVSQAWSTELPYRESMDDYLDALLPTVRALGEDLRETEFYLDRPWLEFRDDESFHDTILHFFNEGGEHLKSVNGDVVSGSWRYLESSNKLMIGSELYDLAFLDSEFFILSKHGNQRRLNRRKYFVMAFEPVSRRLEWRNLMEKMYAKYRNSNSYYYLIAFIIVLLMILLVVLSQ